MFIDRYIIVTNGYLYQYTLPRPHHHGVLLPRLLDTRLHLRLTSSNNRMDHVYYHGNHLYIQNHLDESIIKEMQL